MLVMQCKKQPEIVLRGASAAPRARDEGREARTARPLGRELPKANGPERPRLRKALFWLQQEVEC